MVCAFREQNKGKKILSISRSWIMDWVYMHLVKERKLTLLLRVSQVTGFSIPIILCFFLLHFL